MKVCEKCGALIKGEVCLRCGNIPGKVNAEVSSLTDTTPKEKHPEGITEAETVVATSIFEKLNPDIFKPDPAYALRLARHKKVFIAVLAMFLLALGALSYWIFNARQQDFVSPVVLSAADIANDTQTFTNSTDLNEKTLELSLNLTQGNFAKDDFAIFAEPANLFVHLFDIKKYLNDYINKEVFDAVKTDFKLKDDDIDVYLSEGFALVYPESSTSSWGFVTKVKNKDFINEKLKVFEANKAAAEKSNKKPLASKTFKIDYKNVEAKLVEVPRGDDKDLYLLVSNSKEFLDRMKELSEGIIPNLSSSAIYAQSKKSLPALGYALVYKDGSNHAWEEYAGWFASKFDYTGLDKILKTVKSSLLVVYGDDLKTNILELNDF